MLVNSVYSFEEAAGLELTRANLGGKGYNLIEMAKIGLPVPPGFIISTESCNEYFRNGRKISDELKSQITVEVRILERKLGKNFGGARNPLLVSVRSGALFSMPGMMDTILNLGINDEVVKGLVGSSSDSAFAYEIYSMFIRAFGKLVLKVPEERFRVEFEKVKEELGLQGTSESSDEFWKKVVKAYKKLVEIENFREIPQDPFEQLFQAVSTVFDSWFNPRAIMYRKVYKISDDLGTAVTVMAMVYGNYDSNSCSGVVFTRNPSTGLKELYGEYLIKAQGEELVSGSRTPRSIAELQLMLPGVYTQLLQIANKIEHHFKDMQDIEFTVESGKIYILQSRSGKRTIPASVKILVDFVEEGVITKEEALKRIDLSELKQMFYRKVAPSFKNQPLAKGLPASPGVAIGQAIFSLDEAVEAKGNNRHVILVRQETKPDDIAGIVASEGVLTVIGGLTSHAAVVARGLGKPCVVGCESMKIDPQNEFFDVHGCQVKRNEIISIDGNTGNVYIGGVPTIEPEISAEVAKLLSFSFDIKNDAKKPRDNIT